MRRRSWCTIVSVVALGSIAAGSGVGAVARMWAFDQDTAGKMPSGWSAVTGEWRVMRDDTAAGKADVLAQVSKEHTGSYFNIASADEPSLRDVTISVRIRAVAGREDQGGGPVWRYRDARNYYIARYNPLEENYRVYKVVNGRRLQLDSADVKAPAGTWHELRVVMSGNQIQCFFDDKKYLDVKDDTFKNAGKVGLWTKADAQTHFDDFRVEGD